MPTPTNRPIDTDTVVYVAVSRELLPKLTEWSEPLRLKIQSQEDNIAVLLLSYVGVSGFFGKKETGTPCS